MDHRETFEAKLANLKLHLADLTQEARHLRMASIEHPNGSVPMVTRVSNILQHCMDAAAEAAKVEVQVLVSVYPETASIGGVDMLDRIADNLGKALKMTLHISVDETPVPKGIDIAWQDVPGVDECYRVMVNDFMLGLMYRIGLHRWQWKYTADHQTYHFVQWQCSPEFAAQAPEEQMAARSIELKLTDYLRQNPELIPQGTVSVQGVSP